MIDCFRVAESKIFVDQPCIRDFDFEEDFIKQFRGTLWRLVVKVLNFPVLSRFATDHGW